MLCSGIFYRSCNQTKPSTDTETDTSTAIQNTDTSAAVTAPATTTPESIKVKLPNGKELDANKGGIEDQLVTSLSGDWKGNKKLSSPDDKKFLIFKKQIKLL